MVNQIEKRRNKYRKIPLKIKVAFLKRVLEEGDQIKKVSAEYKINYSTAKTLLRNQRLKKGKLNLQDFDCENYSLEKTPTQIGDSVGTVCSFRLISCEGHNQGKERNQLCFPKIQIISRISFP